MEDQLISFELAKLAKEKGFNIRMKYYYNRNNEIDRLPDIKSIRREDKLIALNVPSQTFAPSQAILQRWLREKHKIDIIVLFSEFSRDYSFDIYKIENGKTIRIVHKFDMKKETYEEALETGLFEALKLI